MFTSGISISISHGERGFETFLPNLKTKHTKVRDILVMLSWLNVHPSHFAFTQEVGWGGRHSMLVGQAEKHPCGLFILDLASSAAAQWSSFFEKRAAPGTLESYLLKRSLPWSNSYDSSGSSSDQKALFADKVDWFSMEVLWRLWITNHFQPLDKMWSM